MKSCLKLSAASRSASAPSFTPATPASSRLNPNQCLRPRCPHTVSFREKCEDEVHTADDWDRSPVDVAHKLSYDDILELKEMQIAAARACARAHAANGTTSRYLSNVPLALLPLLPESGATAPPTSPTSPRSLSPSPPGSPTSGMSSIGLTLAEACLCRVFSADTGTAASNVYGHKQSCSLHPNASNSPATGRSTPTPARTRQAPFKLNVMHQIPSPPDTPPRALLTSIPPPPPTARARNFTFLPLLDASSSTPSPASTPSTSSLSSPVLSRVTSPSPSPSSPRPARPNSSSSSSSYLPAPSPGAYTAYDPYGGFRGAGGSATLGLERKLGFASSDSGSESGSDEDEEDTHWPHDWPGKHASSLHPHHKHQHPSDVKCSSSPNAKHPPALPPSPPAESSPLPSLNPSSGSNSTSPRAGASKALSSPSRGSLPASSSSPVSPSASRSSPSPPSSSPQRQSVGKRKTLFSLVMLV